MHISLRPITPDVFGPIQERFQTAHAAAITKAERLTARANYERDLNEHVYGERKTSKELLGKDANGVPLGY